MLVRILFPLSLFLYIALSAVLLVGPFWQQAGIPLSADVELHLHRSAAVQRAFEQGVYWPRWFPTVYNGLGAPTFHHYSPGLYWLVGAIHWAGIRLDIALKVVLTAAFVLSGLGVYAWLRRTFSLEAGLAGVSLFLAQTYIFREIYLYGDYPQFLAILLLPVCLWAFTALHWHSGVRNWIAAVVSLAGLVFSHNLTTMVGASVLGLYWVMLAVGHRKLDGLLRCVAAALLAALLSAAFWLPALADVQHVRIDNLQRGFFHFSNHFLKLHDLFAVPPLYLDSRAGNQPIPHDFGIAPSLAVAAGLVTAFFFTSRKTFRVWSMAGSLFALAMLTLTVSASAQFWETIPGFDLIQFPYRFLPIATLGALPAAAVAIDVWPTARRWCPALVLVLTSTLLSFPFLFPAHTSPVVSAPNLTAEDTRMYERTSGVWGMSGGNEFLAQGADWDMITERIPGSNVTSLTWRSPHEALAIPPKPSLSTQAEQILLRLHFHPAWSTRDRAVLTRGASGLVQVTGRREPTEPIEIYWEGTGWQHWGERLSLLGLVASLAGLSILAFRRGRRSGWRQRRESRHRGEPFAAPHSSPLAPGALVTCLLALVVARFVLDRFDGGPFLLHSPPGELAFEVEGQPTTLGAPADSHITLLGWNLISGGMPQPGDTVVVRLYWQPRGSINKELHSFLHLYTPSLQRSWAVTQNHFPGHTHVTKWDEGKYYVDTFRLTIPVDAPPITYSLVAGMVSPAGERLKVPGAEDGMQRLGLLTVAPSQTGFLQQERAEILARAATTDGLRLQGYDLMPDPGGPILRLFWETDDVVGGDWTTYIHLHDFQGELVAQFDGPALAGFNPTSQWQTRALYIDRRQLNLPPELRPGRYLFRIGLYDCNSGERLPFRPDSDDQDNFDNGQLLVPLTIPDRKSNPGTGAGG